jgi:hypothetical protein
LLSEDEHIFVINAAKHHNHEIQDLVPSVANYTARDSSTELTETHDLKRAIQPDSQPRKSDFSDSNKALTIDHDEILSHLPCYNISSPSPLPLNMNLPSKPFSQMEFQISDGTFAEENMPKGLYQKLIGKGRFSEVFDVKVRVYSTTLDTRSQDLIEDTQRVKSSQSLRSTTTKVNIDCYKTT